jgi:hypothetical protein
MPMPETKMLDRIENELDQILDRTRRNYQDALEIIRDIELDDLSPESRERLYGQIHALREMVRILSPEFQKKLMVETAKLRRGLSPTEVLRLVYGVDEL